MSERDEQEGGDREPRTLDDDPGMPRAGTHSEGTADTDFAPTSGSRTEDESKGPADRAGSDR